MPVQFAYVLLLSIPFPLTITPLIFNPSTLLRPLLNLPQSNQVLRDPGEEPRGQGIFSIIGVADHIKLQSRKRSGFYRVRLSRAISTPVATRLLSTGFKPSRELPYYYHTLIPPLCSPPILPPHIHLYMYITLNFTTLVSYIRCPSI